VTVKAGAAGAAATAAAGLALGLWVAGERRPDALDAELLRGIAGSLGNEGALLRVMLLPTEPYVLVPLIALMTLVCALRRRWDDVIFCLAGTALPVALNTWVLKPLFDRPLGDYLAYPSGHTVSLVSTLTVLVVLARKGRARAVAASAAAIVTLTAGAGLVGSGFHYPTDVVGGACFAVAAVLTVPRRAAARKASACDRASQSSRVSGARGRR
jgi:membrane-associated phospholipid phosphatase